jgi:hypothetical protein
VALARWSVSANINGARGEFSVLRDRNPSASEAAGLSFDIKFDLMQVIDLPYNRLVLGAARSATRPDTQARHAASVPGARRHTGGISRLVAE